MLIGPNVEPEVASQKKRLSVAAHGKAARRHAGHLKKRVAALGAGIEGGDDDPLAARLLHGIGIDEFPIAWHGTQHADDVARDLTKRGHQLTRSAAVHRHREKRRIRLRLGVGLGQVAEAVEHAVQRGEGRRIDPAADRFERVPFEQPALEVEAVDGIAAAEPDAGISIDETAAPQALSILCLERGVHPHE